MTLDTIQENLKNKSIFHSNDSIEDFPTVIGYEKLFKWRWFATQLNTFIVAIDLGDTLVTEELMERMLGQSFDYSKKNYKGWPRGLQSGVGVVTILISKHLDAGVIEYCKTLKSGKKWAAFTVPVVIDAASNQVHCFEKNPMWGRIYYPYFKDLIDQLT